MAYLSQLASYTLQNIRQTLSYDSGLGTVCVRYAAKKASTSTRNKPLNIRPKHRGWKVQDGHFVNAGHKLVLQLTCRFHPGLHVGFGSDRTLYALESGKVMVTCEKINPNLGNYWVRKSYAGRENSVIYKKHFNIIPEPQHNRFMLINTI
ncbi:PREDICTED: 39S ribosomal protein L27, mitochondrial [Dinoponera quadriceps]|uniref:Large ribosomal subunit protein bL27m n=1 Tax=Dinoponera quadriceps TaxID=609295 RepID=A0A6P3WRY9_DINQU|nr:PREDICTED: 39S ribosomal protein L27, mitochondrial [Dinoponera quadriceps]